MQSRFQKLLEDKDFYELIKGSVASFFLRFGGLGIGYMLTLIIANLFGAKTLGEYVIVITVLSFFSLLSKIGLDTTAIRLIASYASQDKWLSIYDFRKKTAIILSFTSVIISFLMYFLAPYISRIVNISIQYIELSAFFVLPMVFFTLNYESLRGLKRIAEFSFFYRVSQALLSVIFITVIYQFNDSAEVPIYSFLLSLLIVSFLSFLSFRYWLKYRSNGKSTAKNEIIKYSFLIKTSIPLMFAQSVQFIMAWSDKLMLGAMTTSEEVAIYYTAFRLSMFAAISLMAVNSIAAPKFAEFFAKNNIEGLKKVAHQSTKMIFWSSFPLVLIFFSFPDFFLGMFGLEFKIGVTTFMILSFGRLISAFSGSVGSILQMTDNQYVYGIIMFLGAIINVSLNLIFIPVNNPFAHFGISGINGAAFASMCSLSFWNLSMVLIIKRKFGFYTFYIPFVKR